MSGKSSSTASNSGIGVLGLLGIVFVTLKLIGIIDWSWWWVTLPFWGGLAFVLGVLALVGIGALLVALFGKGKPNRRTW